MIKHHRMEELLGSQSSLGRAGGYNSEKKKKRKKGNYTVLTVNDRNEENKVPSSYLDSLAKTPSKMVTNYKDKKYCNYFY